jgi:hypothetical protein
MIVEEMKNRIYIEENKEQLLFDTFMINKSSFKKLKKMRKLMRENC